MMLPEENTYWPSAARRRRYDSSALDIKADDGDGDMISLLAFASQQQSLITPPKSD